MRFSSLTAIRAEYVGRRKIWERKNKCTSLAKVHFLYSVESSSVEYTCNTARYKMESRAGRVLTGVGTNVKLQGACFWLPRGSMQMYALACLDWNGLNSLSWEKFVNLFHVKAYCYLTSKKSISPLEMVSCHEIFKQKTGKVLIFNDSIKHTWCCVLYFFVL